MSADCVRYLALTLLIIQEPVIVADILVMDELDIHHHDKLSAVVPEVRRSGLGLE